MYHDPGVKKVKLFLCSRDINVGDIVQHDIGEAKCETEEQKEFYLSRNSFKVIGIISTDALSYVKEGDEFDRNQILVIEWGGRILESLVILANSIGFLIELIKDEFGKFN